MGVEEVVVPQPVDCWLFEYLDNNEGLVQANPAYLLYKLCQIFNQAISAAKSFLQTVPYKSQKRNPEQEEDTTVSRSNTPIKHHTKKVNKTGHVAKELTPVQYDEQVAGFDPDATEEEMEVEEQVVLLVDVTAAQRLYDPETPYRCASLTLQIVHMRNGLDLTTAK